MPEQQTTLESPKIVIIPPPPEEKELVHEQTPDEDVNMEAQPEKPKPPVLDPSISRLSEIIEVLFKLYCLLGRLYPHSFVISSTHFVVRVF